jgi:type VI secretion system protein ImpJ
VNQRVVWSEGLHVQQQHFQQLERSVDDRFHDACKSGAEWFWGFSAFTVDPVALENGKFGIAHAQGVFKDGTRFRIEGPSSAVLPLDVADNVSDAEVCLCLPSAQLNRPTHTYTPNDGAPVRFRIMVQHVHDAFDVNQPIDMELAMENLQLRFSTDIGAGFEKLPIARVSKKPGMPVQVGDAFVPALLSCAHPMVQACQAQLLGMFHLRAASLQDAIAGQKGGMAGVTEFLMLQTVNRYLPFLEQVAHRPRMAFSDFYFACQHILGDLHVFSTKNQNRMVKGVPLYDHDDPYACLQALMAVLRELFGEVLDRSAIRVNLEDRSNGHKVALVEDPALFDVARFVLAVKAAVGEEHVRSRLPGQIKVASLDKIASLLSAHSAGVPISALSMVPSQIPFHAGFTYFEFDQGDVFWKDLTKSGALVIDPPRDFPELEIELWAIKE